MTDATSIIDLTALEAELAGKSPVVILKRALALFDNIAVSFSGAEDVVLVDMAARLKPDLQVITLDTGRLHPETYRFIEEVRDKYPIRLDVLSPDAALLEPLVRQKGLFSFYRDGHVECCGIRKVEPLRRRLVSLDAWITGQRRDQSLTRQNLPEVEHDPTFSTVNRVLIKFNPLSNWTSAQVWDYIEAYRVPVNTLHSKGFVSIGCEPCTRAVLPHQHERAGRWWWEDSAKKECGLHAAQSNANRSV